MLRHFMVRDCCVSDVMVASVTEAVWVVVVD